MHGLWGLPFRLEETQQPVLPVLLFLYFLSAHTFMDNEDEDKQNVLDFLAPSLQSLTMATDHKQVEDAVGSPDETRNSIQWKQCMELNYTLPAEVVSMKCFHCGKIAGSSPLLQCSSCHIARYCDRSCQLGDWKKGSHKVSCPTYSRLDAKNNFHSFKDIKHQNEARSAVFGRVRIYACSFVAWKTSKLGRGFLFIQSDCTLATLSLAIPKDAYGRAIPHRSLVLHYLTLGEYDSEVCRDDFELAHVRTALQAAVSEYDYETQVVLLMRFRCGHVAVGIAPLVPEYSLCQALGRDYYADKDPPVLQLNLDGV